jgi:methionyl-tRNA formyltransferase
MGTPAFAVPSLDILIKNKYDVAAVVTAPDKPAGRGQKIKHSAVKKYALINGLKILQPTNLKDQQWLEELKSLQANLFIVVAFRMLPESVWKMPEYGTFNLHASLLPQYRGAAPINWAVINGEKETGVTTFFLQHEIDTGNIILQQKTSIADNESAGELHDRLMTIGADLVLQTVKLIEENSFTLTNQDQLINNIEIKHAPKLTKETGRLTVNLTVNKAHNLIRGLSPYPAAFAELFNADTLQTLNLKVYNASLDGKSNSFKTGSVETDHKSFVKIHFIDGSLSLTSIQPAGKSRMTIKDFLNGNKLDGTWQLKHLTH